MGEGSKPQNGAGCTHAQLLGVQRRFALPSPESQLLKNAGVREELWPPAYGGGGEAHQSPLVWALQSHFQRHLCSCPLWSL